MRKLTAFVLSCAAMSSVAQANLLTNGDLDVTVQQEIVPGFFLPWPAANWVAEGSRSIAGPYNDFMSSEPWAGPAPTPVTNNGVAPGDWAVFFKPFSGNPATNGLATGHLYQDVAATPGQTYTFSGWAGGEPNFMGRAEMAVEFIDINGLVMASSTLDLLAAGLLTDNGLAFDYKNYSVSGVAPAGAIAVRGRVSMLDAQANPAGGGQAFVVDDFSLVVPEPTSLAALSIGGVMLRRRRA